MNPEEIRPIFVFLTFFVGLAAGAGIGIYIYARIHRCR